MKRPVCSLESTQTGEGIRERLGNPLLAQVYVPEEKPVCDEREEAKIRCVHAGEKRKLVKNSLDLFCFPSLFARPESQTERVRESPVGECCSFAV